MPSDRVRRLAEAAMKRAMGVVTGNRALEAEGAAGQAREAREIRDTGGSGQAERSPGGAAGRPRRRGAWGAVDKGDA